MLLLLNPLGKSDVVHISGYCFTPWRERSSALAREKDKCVAAPTNETILNKLLDLSVSLS